MKISGFTFIRNGITFGYPFIPAITSMMPICDEVVVVVGKSDDATREAVAAIDSPKIRIVDTVWDDTKRTGGQVLAEQTNIALDHITGDWGFYLQGDEVIHERYLPGIRAAMEASLLDTTIDGLLFNYLHFYGSYDYVATSRNWYRKEIRVVRNDPAIRSWGDAQGFRKLRNGQMVKLTVQPIDAYIYHYGWVRPPTVMQEKLRSFHKLWHDDTWVETHVQKEAAFEYSDIQSVKRFEGSHPAVMQPFVEAKNWEYQPPASAPHRSIKHVISDAIERMSGYRIGEYKNYSIK